MGNFRTCFLSSINFFFRGNLSFLFQGETMESPFNTIHLHQHAREIEKNTTNNNNNNKSNYLFKVRHFRTFQRLLTFLAKLRIKHTNCTIWIAEKQYTEIQHNSHFILCFNKNSQRLLCSMLADNNNNSNTQKKMARDY